MVSAAAHGNALAFQALVEAMEYNRTCCAYTQFPCECSPRCPEVTHEQAQALNERMKRVMQERQTERNKKNPPIVPKFDKWIFPVIERMGTHLSIDQIL